MCVCVFLTEGGTGRIRYASVYRGKKLLIIIAEDVVYTYDCIANLCNNKHYVLRNALLTRLWIAA